MHKKSAAAACSARKAQASWAVLAVRERLAVVRQFRHTLAANGGRIAEALARTRHCSAAEALSTEVIPLAAACRFLEREAARLLAPKRLGRAGRPLWLFGTDAEVRREPLGVLLILAPGNYPLLLPGVQALQALAAGNAVMVKPARECAAVARELRSMLRKAGLPDPLLQVLDEDPAGLGHVLDAGIDKVVLTGSADTGRAVLADLAPRLIPAIMELSGHDAAFVLPGAELDLVAAALMFGLTLNSGATCIAPRRVFVPRDLLPGLETRLARLLATAPAPVRDAAAARQASLLVGDALSHGARILGGAADGSGAAERTIVLTDVHEPCRIIREPVFAPVQALVPVADFEEALRLDRLCPYALGASVFGPVRAARQAASHIRAGSVTVNDVIVPTADPRLPFGGRGESGYGLTRGAEGLLALTAVKTVSVRRGRLRPHYEGRAADAPLFLSYLRAAHGAGLRARIPAVIGAVRAAARRSGGRQDQ